MTQRESWGPFLQAAVAILLAAFAGYGGVRSGQSESRATVAALSDRLDDQQAQMDRMEANLTWLVRHQLEVADRASGRK